MARRPEDTRGSLVFQEGKEIEGDFYIIAVYDDPASATVSFSAYELENDSTYTYPLTYSEFDHLFKFDAELMNPSNQDARFHWVIERLDFVQDNRAQKVLCLAQEPTPVADDDEEDNFMEEHLEKKKTQEQPQVGGRVDAATRAKLLKELDTQDEEKQQITLVKSEAARKRFIAELHSKRNLEQLKAAQRLLKVDEERESRLKKLEIMRQAQKLKAEKFRADQEAKQSTMAQLENLMKQKEAQAIRKLIQEKDEADRGMGREKDSQRQRRKMQERSAAEIALIEAEKGRQLGQKRDDQVKKRDQLILRKNRQIAEEDRQKGEDARLNQVRLDEMKKVMIEELWRTKREARQVVTKKKQAFLKLEEVRERVSQQRDEVRAAEELEYIQELRKHQEEKKQEITERRESILKDRLLRWKIEASDRALAVKEQQKRIEQREQRIAERVEARSKRARESNFLSTVRNMKDTDGEEGDAPAPSSPSVGTRRSTVAPGSPMAASLSRDNAELVDFHKTYEQQERQKRHAEREAKRKAEEEKKGKLQHLGAKDPTTTEKIRIRAMLEEQEARKKTLEDAQLKRELEVEHRARDQVERAVKREEAFERGEARRQEKETAKEAVRVAKEAEHTKGLAIASGLPRMLVF